MDIVPRLWWKAQWVDGYLSGTNVMNKVASERLVGEGTTLPARMQWVESYCRAKPLASVAEAAGMQRLELAKKNWASEAKTHPLP